MIISSFFEVIIYFLVCLYLSFYLPFKMKKYKSKINIVFIDNIDIILCQDVPELMFVIITK